MAERLWHCDGCGQEVYGAAQYEVLCDGWKIHRVSRDRKIIVCGACNRRSAERRRLEQAVKR